MAFTNSDIVPAALKGKSRTSATGSFSTEYYRPEFTRYGAPYVGMLPKRLARILNARFATGAVSQVIYSYSTPIAWKDGDMWVVPFVKYSATTSTKHMPHLYSLPNRQSIPFDAGMDEYMRVLDGAMAYNPHVGTYGTYAPVKGA